MKKSLLALLAVASLVACNRDDDKSTTQPENVKPQEASIVGVWKLEKIEYYNGKDNTLFSVDNIDECKAKGSLEFTKDGKYISKTYALDQGVCKEDGSSNGDYSFDVNTKEFIEPMTGKREKVFLTETELRFNGDAPDLNGDKIDEKSISYYRRQK